MAAHKVEAFHQSDRARAMLERVRGGAQSFDAPAQATHSAAESVSQLNTCFDQIIGSTTWPPAGIIWAEELNYRAAERDRIQTERLRYMLNPEGRPEIVPVMYSCILIDGNHNQVLKVQHRSADGTRPVIIRLSQITGKIDVMRGLPGWNASGYRYFVYYCGGNEPDCLYHEVFMAGHKCEHEVLVPQARPRRVLDL